MRILKAVASPKLSQATYSLGLENRDRVELPYRGCVGFATKNASVRVPHESVHCQPWVAEGDAP